MRWCQPDGLLLDIQRGRCTIVECKLQHTIDAWWQLTDLYLPVVRAALGPTYIYSICEVCRWYDSRVSFPEEIRLSPDVFDVPPHRFGVHIWRP